MLIQGFGCKTQTMWWITKHGSKIKKLKLKKATKQMSDVHCEIKITITIRNKGLWTQRAFGQLLRATRRWDQEIKSRSQHGSRLKSRKSKVLHQTSRGLCYTNTPGDMQVSTSGDQTEEVTPFSQPSFSCTQLYHLGLVRDCRPWSVQQSWAAGSGHLSFDKW